jgi:hypothetical protein
LVGLSERSARGRGKGSDQPLKAVTVKFGLGIRGGEVL